MAQVFANSEDPDQMLHSALFAKYPFRGLPTTRYFHLSQEVYLSTANVAVLYKE